MAWLLESVCAYAEALSAHEGSAGIYVDGADAFELFIQSGGNVKMYEALAMALSSEWLAAVGTAKLSCSTPRGI